MNIKAILKFVGLCALIFIVLSCGSAPVTSSSSGTSSAQKFTGNGGRGMTITVLELEPQGLPVAQNYIPAMIQGIMVGDFLKFSAMTVQSRLSLDEALKEAKTGNDIDYAKLSEVSNVEYALTGAITLSESGYDLQLQVIRIGVNATGSTIATYYGFIAEDELNTFVGIRRASLEILTQVGVNLTGRARDEIVTVEREAHVEAHTALSKGIVAHRTGHTIEAMVRFYEATLLDPSFAEAEERAESTASSIRAGVIGDNFRSDIVWRDAWVALVNSATRFMLANLPVVARVVYNPDLIQDNIDYDRRTAEYVFYASIVDSPDYPPAYLKVMSDLNMGLEATGRNNAWNISRLTPVSVWNSGSNNLGIQIRGELINSEGKVIGRFTRDSSSRTGDMSFGEARISTINADNDYFKLSFSVAADDITNDLTINLTSTGSVSNRSYPVQVVTIPEYHKFLAASGGLPVMETAQVTLQSQRARRDSDNKVVSIEIANNFNERSFHLSYRPSLEEDSGMLLRLNASDVFDTTHYLFPVTLAVFAFDASHGGILRIVDVDPGKREQMSRLSGSNASDFTVLIVPKGWFGRNNIRVGDLLVR